MNSSNMPLSIIESTLKYAHKNCVPLIATIETTVHCNFKCHHCYNFDRNKSLNDFKPYTLEKSQVLKAIKELKQLGTLFLNFSGGESLVDPNLAEYVKYARELALEARVKTNGSLFTIDKCKELQDAGLGGMDISLYGGTPETYNKFVQKDLFREVIAGLENIKKFGFKAQLSFILHRYNIDEIDEMKKIAEHFDIPYQFSTEVTERYDGTKTSRDYEMTLDQFESLLKGPHKHFFEHENKDGGLQCSCARSVIGIAATGDIYPCIGAPIKAGSILDSTLEEVWNHSDVFKKIRGLKTEDFEACKTCEFKKGCNRSSGSIYINTGNYTGCEDSVLAQAKIMTKHLNESKS